LPAAIEQGEIQAALHGQLSASRADGTSATDKKNFQGLILLLLAELRFLDLPPKDFSKKLIIHHHSKE
jgi:hypothetical protein